MFFLDEFDSPLRLWCCAHRGSLGISELELSHTGTAASVRSELHHMARMTKHDGPGQDNGSRCSQHTGSENSE